MAENSISWMFNPAEQAEKNQKASENIGKSLGNGPVNSWDKGKVAMVNSQHAPNEYVNTAVLDAVNWLDAKMSVIKRSPVKHDNPMGYVASGQAYRDAMSLVGTLRGAEAKKLDNVIKVLQTNEASGQRVFSGDEAGERIRQSAESAKDATYGKLRWGPFTGESRRTKEAAAIEYAAAGSEDLLLSMEHDIDKLKKAIQASYIMYLKTGNESYVHAGGTARKLLAEEMGATDAAAYGKQMEFYRTILDLSQGADAAVPDSPYVDTSRYAAIKQLMDVATEKYKQTKGAETENSDSEKEQTATQMINEGKRKGVI